MCVCVLTGVKFDNFKWFGKLEESIMSLKQLRSKKGEKISIFSFNILVSTSVSCTDLLVSKLFNLFFKLNELKLEKEKFKSLYFSLISSTLGCL